MTMCYPRWHWNWRWWWKWCWRRNWKWQWRWNCQVNDNGDGLQVREGDSAILTCRAGSGNPTPDVQVHHHHHHDQDQIVSFLGWKVCWKLFFLSSQSRYSLITKDCKQISVDGSRHPPKNFIDSTMLTVPPKITQMVSTDIIIVIIFIIILMTIIIKGGVLHSNKRGWKFNDHNHNPRLRFPPPPCPPCPPPPSSFTISQPFFANSQFINWLAFKQPQLLHYAVSLTLSTNL